MKQPDLPREIELKLRLPRGSRALVEASRWFARTPGLEIHQVTTYFDTSDRALDRVGLTLRVRRIGTTRIQTVKSRPDNQGIATNRNEWEWSIAQDTPDISRLAKTPSLAGAARTLNGKLERLFVTDIHRTVRLLHLGVDTVVEAAIDEGTIKAGGKCEVVSELELELEAGSVEQIYRVAADLQALVPLWISPESKAARGWYLRTGHTPTVRATLAPRLERSIRAAQGFQDMIARTLGHLIANISPTLHGVAEGLHEMRIALRATRATLKLFEGHLAPSAVDTDLQRFGRIFGTARDWNIFCLQTLPAAVSELGRTAARTAGRGKCPAEGCTRGSEYGHSGSGVHGPGARAGTLGGSGGDAAEPARRRSYGKAPSDACAFDAESCQLHGKKECAAPASSFGRGTAPFA